MINSIILILIFLIFVFQNAILDKMYPNGYDDSNKYYFWFIRAEIGFLIMLLFAIKWLIESYL